MYRKYTGIMIEESLEDNRIVNAFQVVNVKITSQDVTCERWHMYTVKASQDDITGLSRQIKEGWYAHFWEGRKVTAVFRDKIFEFNYDDKTTWRDAVQYGISVGIEKHQLDFPINEMQ